MARRCIVAVFNERTGWAVEPSFIDALRKAAPPGVEVAAARTRAELLERLPETDYLVGFPLTEAALPLLGERLKWVQLTGPGGETHVPALALIRRGVRVSGAARIRAPQVAEHAALLILALLRRLDLCAVAQLERRWATDEVAPLIRDLAGATVGVVSMGVIGETLAARLSAFGAEVIATADIPGQTSDLVSELLPAERLDELLGRADVVVVANPAPRPRPLLLRREFDLMQPGAVLVDVSVGGIVSHADLIWALERDRIAGAAIDVSEQTPLPPDSPLWSMRAVIVTPHVSPDSPRYWDRVRAVAADSLQRLESGEEPLDDLTDRFLAAAESREHAGARRKR